MAHFLCATLRAPPLRFGVQKSIPGFLSNPVLHRGFENPLPCKIQKGAYAPFCILAEREGLMAHLLCATLRAPPLRFGVQKSIPGFLSNPVFHRGFENPLPCKIQKGAYAPFCILAEREGFEPSIRGTVYTLSRRAPSTTRTPLQNGFFAGWTRACRAGCQPTLNHLFSQSAVSRVPVGSCLLAGFGSIMGL